MFLPDGQGDFLRGQGSGSSSGGLPQAAAPPSAELDYKNDRVREYAQSQVNAMVAIGMFQNETHTKATLINILTKLEDKYQVRG